MADSTLEATGDQSYLPAVDTRRPQLEISPNLQTTPQVQAKPVTVPSANNSRTFHITKQIQDDSSGFQASSPGVDFRRAHKAQSPTQPNPQMGWVWAQFSGPPMGRGPIVRAHEAFGGAHWAPNSANMPILGIYISYVEFPSIFEYLSYRLRPLID